MLVNGGWNLALWQEGTFTGQLVQLDMKQPRPLSQKKSRLNYGPCHSPWLMLNSETEAPDGSAGWSDVTTVQLLMLVRTTYMQL